MSQKIARKERTDNKVIELTQSVEQAQRTIEDLESQIKAAAKAREDKLTGDIDYLYNNIVMVSHKYLTVEGYMDARNTFESLIFDERIEGHEDAAKEVCLAVARDVSNITFGLAEKIKVAGPEEVAMEILDGITTEEFVTTDFSRADVCRELILANFMRNVEPALEALVQFRQQTDEALESLNKALDEAKEKLAEAKASIKDTTKAE